MPKLTRLLVCGIAAAILTSPATPDLAWAVFVRTAPPPLPQAPSGTGHRIVEWFGHLAITGGRADITSGEGTWVFRCIGARFGLLPVAPRSWRLAFRRRPLALNGTHRKGI